VGGSPLRAPLGARRASACARWADSSGCRALGQTHEQGRGAAASATFGRNEADFWAGNKTFSRRPWASERVMIRRRRRRRH